MKPEQKYTKIYLYCDGASRGNPGPAAIAYLIKDEAGNILKQESKRIPDCTNNTAEYKAIILGLKACHNFTSAEVIVCSDSNLAINQINKKWKINVQNLKELFSEVKEDEQSFRKVIYLQKSRSDKNLIEADKLANMALDS
jgi:ribonuclease HI